MTALVFATLISSSFSLVVRWGQGRKANLLVIGAVNYVSAAVTYTLLAALYSPHAPAPATLWIGVGGGAAYVVAYFLLLPALRMRGVSIPSALVRLSVLFPIVLSLAVWHERPTAMQSVGILLALVSLPMLGYRPGEAFRAGLREYGVLAGLFVLNGLCLTAVKGFQEYGSAREQHLFFCLLFGTAALVCTAAAALMGERPAPQDWVPGLLLGACNVLGNLMLLYALREVPGVVAFPFHSSVGLVYTVLMAHLIWGERMGRIERVGIAAAVVAVALVVR